MTRNALGQFAHVTPFDRTRQNTRRRAILQRHADACTTGWQHDALRDLAQEWGLAVPPPAHAGEPRTLPEVAPGVFANTDDPAFVAALEAL